MAGKHRPKIAKGKRLAVYVRDNWTCQYCGIVFTPQSEDELTGRLAPWLPGYDWLELDHIVPRALGGDDSLQNLRAACTPCNKRKLATTRHTKWDIRIQLAHTVLESEPPTEETALKAAALLLGYLQNELPRPQGMPAHNTGRR